MCRAGWFAFPSVLQELHPLIIRAKELSRTVWDRSGKQVDDRRSRSLAVQNESSSSSNNNNNNNNINSPFPFKRMIKEIEFTDKMIMCCGCVEKYVDTQDVGPLACAGLQR
jgi:hypothetical protein